MSEKLIGRRVYILPDRNRGVEYCAHHGEGIVQRETDARIVVWFPKTKTRRIFKRESLLIGGDTGLQGGQS